VGPFLAEEAGWVEMRERWVVDAMNVIGSRPDGWWKDRKRAMRDFAVAVNEHAQATTQAMTVVFDQDSSRVAVAPTRPTTRSSDS
jgi:hypothetical protein